MGTEGLPTGETTDIRQLGQSQEPATNETAAIAASLGATLPDPDLIRLFMEEEDLHVYVLIDNSLSMDFGTPSKLHFAKQVAAE